MFLTILHLYPDLLNLYGDIGNLTTLSQRLLWRGIQVQQQQLLLGEQLNLDRADIVLIGGGEGLLWERTLENLAANAATLRQGVAAGLVVLGINEGYQLLGEYYQTLEGRRLPMMGVIPCYTQEAPQRLVVDLRWQATAENSGAEVVGYENHLGRTWLLEGASAWGQVLEGQGNNGEDGSEGARYKNAFGSYSHGPLLPKNPALADYLLNLALQRGYPGFQLPPLDDSWEQHAWQQAASRRR